MLWNLLIGSILLGSVHAAIPNHWLPVVLIGRAEGWSERETLGVVALSGFFHTLSTVVLGIVIGAIGMEVSERLEVQTRLVASLLLVFMGLIYFAMHNANAPHEHVPKRFTGRSKATIITTLSVAMLFRPVWKSKRFFTAGTLGWLAIATLAVTYTVVTIACMVGLTAVSFRGLGRVNWYWFDHNEKRITGGILIALGIVIFLLNADNLMAHEHNHDGHDHDDADDVDLIEAGTTPAADAAPAKKGPDQTWRTYAPAITSLVLLLGGIALDYFKLSGPTIRWFQDPVRLIWYVVAYLPVGWPVLKRAWSSILNRDVFTEFFLMGVATLGAFAIREYPEGVAVMLFYTIGELFQDAAVLRARRSIKALLDVRPDEVTVLRNGQVQTVKAATVEVGDVIQIKAGERVGLDGTMRSDSGTFNTAALTGESVPRSIAKGEAVLAGMINQQSLVEMDVTTPYQDSKLSRILKLVQQATGRKAQTQEFIARFAQIYTPIICLLALLITVVPYFFVAEYQFQGWLYRGLVFLVIGCPCALVISIPLGYFGGIGAGSRQGILFKGSVFLDLMTQLKIVVMDKTGTLTKGVFKVQEVKPVGMEAPELARLTAALESKSTHPVATAIIEYAGKEYESVSVDNVEEIAGHGLKGQVDGKEMLAGNAKLLRKFNILFDEALTKIPFTIVMVAIDGQFAGHFTIADEIKPDAADAVKRLKADGIRTVMLSGDKSAVVEIVAKQVGIDEYYGDLLPEDKVAQVERLKADLSSNPKAKLAFVGDGVNDAPVVALADVGMAMGGLGSDATIETADVIIQNDEPSKIAMAIAIGRATRRIVWQNITLSLMVKGIVLVLGAGGLATMWEAVFADVGVALLAILNAVRVQNLKFREWR